MMLRTLLSIAIGLAAILFLFLLGNGVLMLANGDLAGHLAAGSLPQPEWVLLDMIVRVMSVLSGGYLAAAIASRAALRHAIAVGAVATVAGLIDLLLATSTLPIWYDIVAVGLILPAAAMGGAIGADRHRIARRLDGAEPRTA
jgi:hypothetical protein